ncbi:precorrin-6A reductase [Desulfitobacterium sp. PCE1]|uniref:precorrin-6A reductase n=1 Tax=Desulfitobacterium sp. PCE1 TaxID=146907 RepID=UPI0003788152|nr:precorrin-6A reductase [Desulfitobacterium sp. PCE1]
MRLFILAGTEDGRELAFELQKHGHEVLVSTLTEYGAEIAERQGLRTCSGALDEHSMERILQEQAIHALIDATHPYAQNIRNLARCVAGKCNLPYFRWERSSGDYPVHPLLHFASNLEDAARLAAQLGKRVFLSTGSKNLRDWVGMSELNDCELYVRVLPTSHVLKQCEEAGLKPYQIIAMQGPFTQKFNEGLWEQLKIDVVITKDSGAIGGTDEKVQACLQLNIPVIVLERPREAQPQLAAEENTLTIEDFIRKVEESFGH